HQGRAETLGFPSRQTDTTVRIYTVTSSRGRRARGHLEAGDGWHRRCSRRTRSRREDTMETLRRRERVRMLRADASDSVGRRAAELREDVGIVSLVPVPEAPAHQLRRGGPRGALEHEVLAVEDVGGIPGILRDPRLESLKSRERRVRPFPSVAHELVDAPRARAFRI